MHEMDRTPKIITIIGLVLEGLGILGLLLTYYIFNSFGDWSFFTTENLDVTQAELDQILELYAFIGNIMLVVVTVIAVFFIVNLYLFIKLIQGKFTEETAKKVYLYQAIWGGINILSNTVVGILYLISGVSGRNGHREEQNIRQGI